MSITVEKENSRVSGPIHRGMDYWITADRTFWRSLAEAEAHHASPENGGVRYQAMLEAIADNEQCNRSEMIARLSAEIAHLSTRLERLRAQEREAARYHGQMRLI